MISTLGTTTATAKECTILDAHIIEISVAVLDMRPLFGSEVDFANLPRGVSSIL